MDKGNLLSILTYPDSSKDDIIKYFNSNVIPQAISNINNTFSPRRLSKLSRDAEPLPTDQRQLSSYRTRLGTMLEYGVSTEIENILYERYAKKLYFTFAAAHEYPDFYLRNYKREQILKIEMKAVDADSDEQAARFDVLTEEINEQRDFIIFVGWIWATKEEKSFKWEFPKIFSWCFIPAIEIAKERDKRLTQLGGKIEKGEVLVPSSKNKGSYVKDPGNFGKLWRIVQKSRRNDPNLNEHIKCFVDFLTKIDEFSPHNRIKKSKNKVLSGYQ